MVFVAKHYLQSALEPFTPAGKEFRDMPRSPGRAVKKLKTPSGRLAYSANSYANFPGVKF
jgi:hypothetical protein